MRFIVLVPFSVIIIAAILGCGIAALVGEVLEGLMGILFVVLKFLFASVCFGGGGFLTGVAAYRLVRVFTKKLLFF